MGTAVLPARRRVAVSAWTVAPSAIALAFGVLYLVLEPRPGDLAVHVFLKRTGTALVRVRWTPYCDDG